jgi:hypothetical protein
MQDFMITPPTHTPLLETNGNMQMDHHLIEINPRNLIIYCKRVNKRIFYSLCSDEIIISFGSLDL